MLLRRSLGPMVKVQSAGSGEKHAPFTMLSLLS